MSRLPLWLVICSDAAPEWEIGEMRWSAVGKKVSSRSLLSSPTDSSHASSFKEQLVDGLLSQVPADPYGSLFLFHHTIRNLSDIPPQYLV